MTKTEYAEYIQSEYWQERRKREIKYAHHACERCDLPRWVAALVYDQDLHVHHRNYQNLGDEQPGDLEVLCRRCHEIETFGRSDYREIKKAECEVCHRSHWNIYSTLCEGCDLLLNGTGGEIWATLVREAIKCNCIEIPSLLAVVSEALREEKEFRRKWAEITRQTRPNLYLKESGN